MKRLFMMMIGASIACAAYSNVKAYVSEGMSIPDVHRGDGRLSVAFTLYGKSQRMASGSSLTITPIVTSADGADSVELPPLKVAGRNARAALVRAGEEGARPVLRAGSNDSTVYYQSLDWLPWMENSEVTLRVEENCCGKKKPKSVRMMPLAELDYRVPTSESEYLETSSASQPYTITGRAYVLFPVNKTDIDAGYLDNDVELQRLVATLDSIAADPSIEVEKITLTGYASPEGGWSHNARLAADRAATVKQLVKEKCKVADEVFQIASVPEDWQGLRRWLVNADAEEWPERDAVIALIDSPEIADSKRNETLKIRHPKAYARLLEIVYPRLRHTDYEIKYTLK